MGPSSSENGDQSIALSDEHLEPLNSRQRQVYSAQLSQFGQYLRTRGKNPAKEIGYSEKSVTTRLSRFHRVVRWIWQTEEVTTEFAPVHADCVVSALNSDSLRKVDSGRFSEGSKRKTTDVLVNWFEFQGTDWEPDLTFSDEATPDHADPFTKAELRQLWQAALAIRPSRGTTTSVPTSVTDGKPTSRKTWGNQKRMSAQRTGTR
jgi:hypothetical protein